MAFNYSPNLFRVQKGVSTSPMVFNVEYCADANELTEFIEFGGGVLGEKEGPYTITLAGNARDCKSAGSTEVFSSKFIWRCVTCDSIQPLKKYKLKSSSSVSEDFDPRQVLLQQISWPDALSLKNRDHDEEDESDDSHPKLQNLIVIGGKVPVVEVERLSRSMLDHEAESDEEALQIEESESEAEVKADEKQLPHNKVSNSKKEKGKPVRVARRYEYTQTERKEMLKYIIEEDDFESLKGSVFWKKMEKHFPLHTWQSLNEHFKKKIFPMIELYKVPPDTVNRMRVAMSKSQRGKVGKGRTSGVFQTRARSNNVASTSTAKSHPKKSSNSFVATSEVSDSSDLEGGETPLPRKRNSQRDEDELQTCRGSNSIRTKVSPKLMQSVRKTPTPTRCEKGKFGLNLEEETDDEDLILQLNENDVDENEREVRKQTEGQVSENSSKSRLNVVKCSPNRRPRDGQSRDACADEINSPGNQKEVDSTESRKRKDRGTSGARPMKRQSGQEFSNLGISDENHNASKTPARCDKKDAILSGSSPKCKQNENSIAGPSFTKEMSTSSRKHKASESSMVEESVTSNRLECDNLKETLVSPESQDICPVTDSINEENIVCVEGSFSGDSVASLFGSMDDESESVSKLSDCSKDTLIRDNSANLGTVDLTSSQDPDKTSQQKAQSSLNVSLPSSSNSTPGANQSFNCSRSLVTFPEGESDANTEWSDDGLHWKGSVRNRSNKSSKLKGITPLAPLSNPFAVLGKSGKQPTQLTNKLPSDSKCISLTKGKGLRSAEVSEVPNPEMSAGHNNTQHVAAESSIPKRTTESEDTADLVDPLSVEEHYPSTSTAKNSGNFSEVPNNIVASTSFVDASTQTDPVIILPVENGSQNELISSPGNHQDKSPGCNKHATPTVTPKKNKTTAQSSSEDNMTTPKRKIRKCELNIAAQQPTKSPTTRLSVENSKVQTRSKSISPASSGMKSPKSALLLK